eukprot:sb/3463811/
MVAGIMPINFGVDFLEFDGLNDLEMTCCGGERLRTSSFPLALNSPVLCDLVGVQKIKELDVEEFSRSSVLCFIQSCYTGSTAVSRENFREVNKLSAVFKVEWMIEECLEFYTGLCSELSSNSLDNVRFLFEEAAYILRERNNKDLQDALNSGLQSFPDLRLSLVQDFMSRDPNKQELACTDLCLSLAGNAIPALYSGLIKMISDRTPPVQLTVAEKRFLDPQTLTVCFQSDSDVYLQLLNTLQTTLCKEDIEVLLKPLCNVFHNLAEQRICDENQKVVYPIELPALEDCKTLLDAIKIFDEEPRIQSWIQFVDCVGNYCYSNRGMCEESEEVLEALNVALEKRYRKYPHSVCNVNEDDLPHWVPDLKEDYPMLLNVLNKYQESGIVTECTIDFGKSTRWPYKTSHMVYLNLHYGSSFCEDNPKPTHKRCKVAVNVSIVVRDINSYPTFTIELEKDQTLLNAHTDPSLHSFKMLYWRAAGLNYLQFSRIAAQAVRRGLKPEAKEIALKAEEGLMKKTKWEGGKAIKA